jgi:anti-sigma regulatory factor (Ser/Thr protein kinase)
VRLALTDGAGRFEVEVTDTCTAGSPVLAGVGVQSGAADGPEGLDGDGLPAGLGIAVIESLADDVQISTTSAGTTIRMSWPSARPAR